MIFALDASLFFSCSFPPPNEMALPSGDHTFGGFSEGGVRGYYSSASPPDSHGFCSVNYRWNLHFFACFCCLLFWFYSLLRFTFFALAHSSHVLCFFLTFFWCDKNPEPSHFPHKQAFIRHVGFFFSFLPGGECPWTWGQNGSWFGWMTMDCVYFTY